MSESDELKQLLMDGFRGPLNFLDEKLRDLEQVVKNDREKASEIHLDANDSIDLLYGHIEKLKNSAAEEAKLRARFQKDIYAEVEAISRSIELSELRTVAALSDQKEGLNLLKNKMARYADEYDSLVKMSDAQKHEQKDIEELIKTFENDLRRMEKDCVSLSNRSSVNSDGLRKAKVDLDARIEQLASKHDDPINQMRAEIEAVKSGVLAKFEVQADRLEKLFEKRQLDLDNAVANMSARTSTFFTELEKMEQRIIHGRNNKSSDKKLDDFMAQVTYNANQIAKLAQKMEK
jgi:hypothetical protein